jgi:hypothetical protein
MCKRCRFLSFGKKVNEILLTILSSVLLNVYLPLLISFPFETVQRAVVTNNISLSEVVKTAGVQGLYKGLGAAVIYATLDILIWELIEKYYEKKEMD